MDDDVVIDLRALPAPLDLTDPHPTFEIALRNGPSRTSTTDAALDELIAAAVTDAVHRSLV